MKRWSELALVVLVAVAFAGLYGCMSGPHPLVGEDAPSMELELLDGGTMNLAQHAGEDIVILDFWATWCGPCRRGMPIIERVAKEYADQGVVLYAVNVAETPSEVEAFLEEEGLDVTVAMDKHFVAARDYEAEGIPQTVIIDKSGRVQAVHVGVAPGLEERLRNELDTLLAGKDLVRPRDETQS